MVILINPASRRNTILKHTLDQPSLRLPYGLAVLAAYLKKHGYVARIVDLRQDVKESYIRILNTEDYQDWLTNDHIAPNLQLYFEECEKVISVQNKPWLFGISVFSYMDYYCGLALAKYLKFKYPDVKICLGGPFVTIKSIKLPDYADFIVRGYGNKPLLHIIDCLSKNIPVDKGFIGIQHKLQGEEIVNPINVEDIEEEELSDFSDLNLNKYRYGKSGVLVLPYRVNVGCKNSCSFCTFKNGFDIGYKSVGKCVNEFKKLRDLSENVYISLSDCTLTNNVSFFNDFLDELIKQKVEVPWQGCANINRIDNQLLEKAVRAGCKRIYWGFEHFSSDMQKDFRKVFDLDDAENKIKYASALGLECEIALIYNSPGENAKHMDILKQNVIKYMKYKNIIFRMYPFHLSEGSLMYREPDKFGIELSEGSDVIMDDIKWKTKVLTQKEFLQRNQDAEKVINELYSLNNLKLILEKYKICLPVRLLLLVNKLYLKTKRIVPSC